MYKVHSFDVFDTCLTRTLARPADVFAAAALRLRANGLARFADHALADVVALRTRAETRARRALDGREDLTLAEIRAHIPADNPFGIAPGYFLAAELAVETSCLRPVAAALAEIRELRRRGRRIVFVTDMFLPAAFIQDRLAEHGFFVAGDGLYVSGEIGLCKWSGRLFTHVLAREGSAARELLHVGDNPRSDVAAPRRLGIRTRQLAEAVLTPREAALLGSLPDHDPRPGLLAGASRTARTARTAQSAQTGHGDAAGLGPELAAVATAVAAPLLMTFVAWVLTEAAGDGLDRLHFVSRDGQILCRLAEVLRRGRTDLPEPRYLHGSRQAWFLPTLTDSVSGHRDWLLVPGHCRRPRSLLARLGLTPADLPELGPGEALGAAFWSRPLPPGDETTFFALLDRPANARVVLDTAAKARSLTTAYFKELAQGRSRLALVDLGWTLKTQAALARVFEISGLPLDLFGYYFGVTSSRVAGLEGRYRAFLTEPSRSLDPAESLNPLFRNANLLEQCFTLADHGQVTGYADRDGKVVPRLRQARPGQARLAAGIQRTVLAVAETWMEQAPGLGLTLEDLAARKSLAVANAVSFLASPTRDEAAALAAIPVFDDQNETRSRVLARALGPADVLRAFVGRNGAYARSFDWLEGSIALSPAWLRPVLRRPRVFAALRQLRKSL